MERSTGIALGAVAAGILVAGYFGSKASHSVATVQGQTMNTSSIDAANASTQQTLNLLTTNQQIANQLGLGTPVSTPLGSTA